MSMFEKIKYKLAVRTIKNKYIKSAGKPQAFNNFTKNALNYLVIIPDNDEDFKNSQTILKYLLEQKKSVTLFISEHRYSVIPEREKYRVLSFSLQQVTKLRLPDPILKEKLIKKSFDVILNLNRYDDVFYDAAAFMVNSSFRVGFKNGEISEFLSLQIPQNEKNSKISYENLLNSLKMF